MKLFLQIIYSLGIHPTMIKFVYVSNDQGQFFCMNIFLTSGSNMTQSAGVVE